MTTPAPFRVYVPHTTYRHCDPRTGLIVPDPIPAPAATAATH
jgi:hypothetical protein